MAKPEDAVLPLLQNVQKELADLKRTFGEGLARVEGKVDGLAERLEAFEGYFTYEMGLTARNQSDIKRLQGEMRALKERVDSLEPQT